LDGTVQQPLRQSEAMQPPKQTVSLISSSGGSSNIAEGATEQSGRSRASLRAETSAASLLRDTRAAGTHGRRSGDSECFSAGFDIELEVDQALFGQSQRATSQAPSTTSTHPAPSSAYSDGITDSSDSKSSDSATHATPSQRTMAAGRPPPIRLPPRPSSQSLQQAQHKSSTDLCGQAGRPPGNPMTYQDLGADYTRYYNPFSISRKSSWSEKQDGQSASAPRTPGPTTPLAAVHPTNPFLTPDPSRSKVDVHVLYDPEKNASVIDDRLNAPYEEKGLAAWPLINDREEDDDEMHMPQPDDDIRYKPRLRDHFTRDGIVSTFGLVLMIGGLLFIFVGLPVLSFKGIIGYNSGFGVPLSWLPPLKPHTWATINDRDYPLLQNIRVGLIDPDTPQSVRNRIGQFGDEYELVFSDEFNKKNRTFYEGDDPYFYAGDFWYGATQDLAWYDPDAVSTNDGVLELRLDKHPNHGLNLRSGMLNSWNHLCFKGGIFEVSVSLPGPAGYPGLWPGAWTMGNLGRPGYLSTTDGMWPYTYQACDVGITPNQSSPDGLSKLPGQRLSSCTCDGEDHPTPGRGRGAPEIDIIEAGSTYSPRLLPIATQSYQVAPFDINWYPNYNFTAIPDHTLSAYNGYTGGPFQQAISATTMLNRDWFDGKAYQRYSFEYAPGEGKDAFISWQIGDQMMWMIDGRSIGPNGNIQTRQIAEEPMSLILNLGISNSWTWIDWDNLVFPSVMRIDYVRWYQKKGEEMVTCDPPGFETTQYIRDHMNAYTNPNFTVSSLFRFV
jgi:beta-glucanase (GH16 family)